MKKVIVTGASGFLGYHLVQELLQQGYFVYAIVRPNSKNRGRLTEMRQLKIIDLAMKDILQLPVLVKQSCDTFYHLAWEGRRDNFNEQYKNVNYIVKAVDIAAKMKCKRFVCTGSQAEYGLQNGIISEDILPAPNTAYGAAKIAAGHLSKIYAKSLGIEWVWGRVFSVYGEFDNPKSLVPYIINTLKRGGAPSLTEGLQNWDYLYVKDAVKGLISLALYGHDGEVYNLASGDVHPLRYFIKIIYKNIFPTQSVIYGTADRMIVSLNPSIQKIQEHTGWRCQFKFIDGINDIISSEDF